jgi:geranylgeranyl pyrophosphate synthase
LAGASEREIEKLADFAIPAGIAFQIQDDIQGINELNELNLARLKGIEYCQKLSHDLISQAKQSLANVKIDKSQKEVLCKLADYLITRKN